MMNNLIDLSNIAGSVGGTILTDALSMVPNKYVILNSMKSIQNTEMPNVLLNTHVFNKLQFKLLRNLQKK